MAKYTARVQDAVTLGRMLQQARNLRGLSQRQLAEELGLTQKAVYAMESGEPTKYAHRLFTMMRATGMSMLVELTSFDDDADAIHG